MSLSTTMSVQELYEERWNIPSRMVLLYNIQKYLGILHSTLYVQLSHIVRVYSEYTKLNEHSNYYKKVHSAI